MYDYLKKYTMLRRENTYYITFLKAMLIGVVASLIVEMFFWETNTGAVHSILELICIVFNMSLFFIVWNKYEDSPISSRHIAFGLLSTAIFDVLHIYYFEPLGISVNNGIDLAPKFWIIGRLTEIILIFIASLNFGSRKIKLGKNISLFVSIFLPVAVSYVIINYPDMFPALYDQEGLTINKIILEIIIITLAIISLIRHKYKIMERGYVSYRYLALALMLIVPAEICLMLYNTYSSSIIVYGHVFKVIYCYFLHKSIFQGSINYTQKELQRSKRRLRNILDAIPIGIQTLDRNFRLDFANTECENLLGCNREEIMGLSNTGLANIFNSDDMGIKKFIENNIDTTNIIGAFKQKDGKDIKLSMDAKTIDGGVLLIIKDAGKEQEIENLNIQTYTILNSMQSAAFICDNNCNIISVNKAFEELIGLSNNRLVGIKLKELNRLINYNRKQVHTNETEDGCMETTFEATITNTRGLAKEIIVHRSNIMNIYGKSLGKISVVTDVTNLKEQQQKNLHQEKLALLGQMGAAIVHETRNFLTTIKGCSQLIMATSDQNRVIEYAAKIYVNTDEVNRIISDFLSLSKPKQAAMEEIAVCDLLKSMESTIETSSLTKDVKIEFIHNLDERYILCDEAQMKQVILNICKNAIEATAELPNPKLTVEAGVIQEKNNIYIKISDNGRGMSKETLDKIGTPFFTTKQSGTGLGLSVCYEIVKQHGGWIDVQSEEGCGTTFIINLPGLEEEEEEVYENIQAAIV
jgi:PAS domain S-box-containing protein